MKRFEAQFVLFCALLTLAGSMTLRAQETEAKPPAPGDSAASEPTILPSDEALRLGRKYSGDFYKNDLDDMWEHMSPAMQRTAGTEAGLHDFNQRLEKDLGKESAILNEVVLPAAEYQVYSRLSTFSDASKKMVTVFTFDRKATIVGFFVKPDKVPAESKFLDYKPKAFLTLPFYGYWTVYQGGRSVYQNFNAQSVDQRFAYDFLIVRAGRQAEGNAYNLEDFFSYSRPVLAPGTGVVVAAVDQYEDNPVAKGNLKNPKEGNNVVIDHGNSEYSMLSHLKRGSVRVHVGDHVKAGDEIALCGNSGNSPAPHISYHLQNTPTWNKGDGLPVFFHKYNADGKNIDLGEPVRGQTVRNIEEVHERRKK